MRKERVDEGQKSPMTRRKRGRRYRPNIDEPVKRRNPMVPHSSEDQFNKIEKTSNKSSRRNGDRRSQSSKIKQGLVQMAPSFWEHPHKEVKALRKLTETMPRTHKTEKTSGRKSPGDWSKTAISMTERPPIPARPSNPMRFKTELCRAHEENGFCRFAAGCTFAHGLKELRQIPRHHKYKTEECKSYHSIGYCQYGTRCHFVHDSEETSVLTPMARSSLLGQYDSIVQSIPKRTLVEGKSNNPSLKPSLNDGNLKQSKKGDGILPTPNMAITLPCMGKANLAMKSLPSPIRNSYESQSAELILGSEMDVHMQPPVKKSKFMDMFMPPPKVSQVEEKPLQPKRNSNDIIDFFLPMSSHIDSKENISQFLPSPVDCSRTFADLYLPPIPDGSFPSSSSPKESSKGFTKWFPLSLETEKNTSPIDSSSSGNNGIKSPMNALSEFRMDSKAEHDEIYNRFSFGDDFGVPPEMFWTEHEPKVCPLMPMDFPVSNQTKLNPFDKISSRDAGFYSFTNSFSPIVESPLCEPPKFIMDYGWPAV